jgi:hypothetical protein
MAGKTVESNKALERARISLEHKASFAEAGMGSVRPLDLMTITEGTTVTLPTKLELFKQPIAGTNNHCWKMITNEGYDFYPSCLTRGATPINGGPRVKPSGTAVEAVQKYSSMDDAYTTELAGKKITFTSATTVVTKGYNGEPTREVKVWQIDFAKL